MLFPGNLSSRAVLGMDLGIAGIPRNSRLVCRESQIVLTAGINSLWECSGSQGSSGSGDSWLHGHGGAHGSGMVSGMFPWIRDGVWEEPTDQGNILLPRAWNSIYFWHCFDMDTIPHLHHPQPHCPCQKNSPLSLKFHNLPSKKWPELQLNCSKILKICPDFSCGEQRPLDFGSWSSSECFVPLRGALFCFQLL